MTCNVIGTVGTNFCLYIYESSSDVDEESFSSYPMQPPSGFSDSSELSGAECERGTTMYFDRPLARLDLVLVTISYLAV
jgi:hypothetical protein